MISAILALLNFTYADRVVVHTPEEIIFLWILLPGVVITIIVFIVISILKIKKNTLLNTKKP
jgi:hypothetical protein